MILAELLDNFWYIHAVGTNQDYLGVFFDTKEHCMTYIQGSEPMWETAKTWLQSHFDNVTTYECLLRNKVDL